ncbi:MAG: ABC transporter ATP-binding protein [Synergistaceae bacterium]|jgi:osmoprotectant transport system ATP-binding protein|nr:ABC transporter ATP-binding protein [Synergistaceae bacterium]
MSVPDGALVVLMGASGSGKTTLLKMVNRLIQPSSGRISFYGEDTAGLDVIELRKKIGYVLQSAALFPHMTVRGNIATVPEILGWNAERIRARTSELLELMGLPDDFAGRYPSQLSGGQQQRVGIARAIAGSPKVLLMDEPFGALDAITRARLQDDLLRIHRADRSTILFVTHDLDEAFRLGDRVAVMNEGELIRYGTPAELIKAPDSDYAKKLLGFLSLEAIRRAEERGGVCGRPSDGTVHDSVSG